MSVYVDMLMNHGWRLGPSCHLYADTLEELHAMAKRIGMRRDWFQGNKPSFPHYDLVGSRREMAVHYGAIEHSSRQMVNWKRAREGRPLLDTPILFATKTGART
jgi:hypothetical protein